MAGKMIFKQSAVRNNGKGYTLVEMIVVLVVLSILAASGIFSAVGYVKKSTFDQNQSNAEAIYHAAQSSLQQMEKAGKINDWVKGWVKKKNAEDKLIDDDKYAFEYVADNQSKNITLESTYKWNPYNNFKAETAKPNTSVHMRFVLTYRPDKSSSEESKLVKDLIQPYFNSMIDKDGTIFQGTITIELDVEKSSDAYKTEHLSAKCLSVFYNSKAKKGWSSSAYDGSATKVPTRAYSHRRDKSLIGYCEGYTGTSVDTVYLPELQEGIKIKKFAVDFTSEPESEDENAEEKTYTWLTWAATNDRVNLIGAQKDVYYRFALYEDSDSGKVLNKVIILNEDFLRYGDTAGGSKKPVDFSDLENLDSTSCCGKTIVEDTYPVIYSDTESHDITKRSIIIDAQVFTADSETDGYDDSENTAIDDARHKVRLKISYVMNEYDSTGTNKKNNYYEYSLDITPFMTAGTNRAVLKIYPNYFSTPTMAKVNDSDGIIPFKKGKSVTIETEPEDPEP